ncbi:hydrolase, TatD family protein [Neorickettsia helminthoeca str. Oregon]|uniref:Hydrolase, TatD family protein n=1 Tax=Neorickettsia helminthoeca str. Oregon TaxID=1286528 RepID=X5H3Z8_9RICK|nr:TatD family hydrolase [Neorickettsia helminthoeca]AHX11296.1 hydrolase, TatD family protein [Neorickettsia helminthoeca str. Oregon]
MIFDSHCHLIFYQEDELEGIVADAQSNGVKILHTIATRLSEYEELIATCERFSDVYCSIGVHPNHVDAGRQAYQDIINLAAHPKVISVGETGLDYYYNHTAKEDQRISFIEHIKAATDLNLPIIVHSRNAEADTIKILETESKDSGIPVILHSFASSRELFEAAVRNSWYLSFSGILTFKNALEIQQIARETPLNRILIETDAPYLAPVPVRGQRNYPVHVLHVLRYLSSLRDMNLEKLSHILLENFFNAFRKVPHI